MTPRAKEFMSKNRTAAIVSGEWLDCDGRQVTGGPDTWDKLRYRLDDGSQFTLSRTDLEALNVAGIKPKWRGVA